MPFPRRHNRRYRVAVLLIAACAPLIRDSHLRAQAPSNTASAVGEQDSGPNTSPHPPSLTVTARLVVLDVVVTDASGKPVDGLTAKDFQVFEDGRPQTIRSLEPPTAHSLPPGSSAAGASFAFDPAQPASFGQSPVDLLVLDQLNTHFADSSFARRSLHDYLAAQPTLLPRPTELLGLYDSGMKPLQSFTRDRDSLLRALASAPAGYSWTLELNGKAGHGPIERLDLSLRALEEIAQSCARIPGRKNLIWVGGGFPSVDPAAVVGSDFQEVKETLQHVTNVLQDTRVTFYAVDPSSTAPRMAEITDSAQTGFVEQAGDSLAGGIDPFDAGEDFDKLGPVTGGRVVRSRNDVAQQIASSVDRAASFYTLAYTPSSTSETAAQYRRIKVVCLRPGLTASTRAGYYAITAPAEHSSSTAAYDLTTAALSAVPLNGLRVTAELDPSPDATPASYVIHAAVDGLTWKPNADGSSTASVYVMAASLNAKKKLVGHVLHGMLAQARPGTDLRDPARTAAFHFTAVSVPGSATLRFVVRDSTTGRMGSFDLSIKR